MTPCGLVNELFEKVDRYYWKDKKDIILTKAMRGKVHCKKQLDKEDFVFKVPDEILIQGLQKEFVNVHFYCILIESGVRILADRHESHPLNHKHRFCTMNH
jgi:hypothetical protein